MPAMSMRSLTLHAEIEQWPLAAPVRIAGHTYSKKELVMVSVSKDGCIGRGEAAGVRYRDDVPATFLQRILAARPSIEHEVSRESLQQLLPPGGARNAIDCALWDLEAKLTGRPAWQIAELAPPRSLLTTFTCGADEPAAMAERSRDYVGARAIKLKLTGEPIDKDRVLAVREARTDVDLYVDANQSFTRPFLERLMPVLVGAGVKLVEQPFPVGQETLLDGFRSPIPVAADESAQHLEDLRAVAGRFDVVNIKLDKCGGLTAGLEMARAARTLGLEPMVGNMFGTSLGMAPAFLLGQICSLVDLDGPVFLCGDRAVRVAYENGYVSCPLTLWGGTSQPCQ